MIESKIQIKTKKNGTEKTQFLLDIFCTQKT